MSKSFASTESVTTDKTLLGRTHGGAAQYVLNTSVKCCLAIALFGQWFFASYILLMYALPVLLGNYQATRLTQPITGFVAGDTSGNFWYFTHIVPAAIISVCGILQLLPNIRRNFPEFHRWNGRVFLTLGLTGALTGLYLTWGRGSRLSDLGAIGITLNGVLIPIAIGFAWWFARTARIKLHRRCAVHAFLLINGVWTFRLYLMTWYIVNQGSMGNTQNLDGPADIFLSFACYLLPMLVAELFFWAEGQSQAKAKWWAGAIISLTGLMTLMGVIVAVMLMWWPRMQLILG